MSRFFANADDSESDSSEDEVEEPGLAPVPRQTFAYGSDDEDVKRVVKPGKDKYHDELKNIIQQMNNFKKINDYTSLLSKFEDLAKAFGKYQNVASNTERIPRFLISFLSEMRSFVTSIWENAEAKKCLNKIGFKSLVAFRQKLKKFIKTYQDDVDSYQPGDEIEDEDSVEENDDSKVDKNEDKVEQESSDSAYVDDSDSESDSENEGQLEYVRESFLKKTVKDGDLKKKEKKVRKRTKDKLKHDEEGDWKTVKGGAVVSLDRQKMFANAADITIATVNAKLMEILILRSSKRSERRQRIELIHELITISLQHSLGLGIGVKLRMAEVGSLYDYNISALDPMKPEYWNLLLGGMLELSTILSDNEGSFNIAEAVEDDEELENAPYKLRGSISSLLERLVDEFHKVLKQLDPFKGEYPNQLRDEKKIGDIMTKVLLFLEAKSDAAELCRVKLCKIEHLYYKLDRQLFENKTDEPSSLEVVDKLCQFIYMNDTTQRLRTRAILANIYHQALHDHWSKARDMMLMSHLQSTIHHADPSTQILYNRTMAQLGLCAFRNGFFTDAHNCLADLWTSGRVREMVGQGFSIMRNVERTREQELRERQYQVPYHMQIPLELVECSYLLAAMLQDVPAMAAQELERRPLISKAFYNVLRNSDKQSLIGPPETMREHVVAASRALRAAKWRECRDLLINPKMTAKIWTVVQQPSPMLEKLVQVIKKQALKSYIFAYAAPVYDSLNLPLLSAMFEMTEDDVRSTLATMIVEGELAGAIHLTEETLVLHKGAGRSTLQALAHQLTDKVGQLLDSVERCVERPYRPNNLQMRYGRSQLV